MLNSCMSILSVLAAVVVGTTSLTGNIFSELVNGFGGRPVLFEEDVASMVECGGLCLTTAGCVGMTYQWSQRNWGVCQGYRSMGVTPVGGFAASAVGSSTFVLAEHRGFVGSDCTSHADCHTEAGIICFKGLCLCAADYVFSVTGNTCILASECSDSDWLSSYMRYPESGVDGHNDWYTYGTVDECLADCSAVKCRAVEREYNYGLCYYSFATVDDSMVLENDTGWNTYRRNCA